LDDPTLRKRLTQIEAQLEILSERAGVPYDRRGADLPPTVRELAMAGKKIHAIQEVIRLTGMSLAEAKQRLDDL
jgi:ribosomal protein L7/L12